MTKHYVDDAGRYLGGWDGGRAKNGTERTHPDVPARAVEVPTAPDDVRQTWNGSAWSAAPGPNYRRRRAAALVAALSEGEPTFEEAVGDYLDEVKTYLEALAVATSVPFHAALQTKMDAIDAIKAQIPKP